MQLPFTTQQFIDGIRSYNSAIGPLPLLAYLLAAGAIYLTFKQTNWGNRAIAIMLASFWAFTGIAYHLISFATINPAARFFGVAFVVQAGLLLVSAFRSKLSFGYRGDLQSKVGLAIVAFSMIGYPLACAVLGHGYPAGPVFALTPCPLLLFTIGMFLLAERTPKHLLVVPMMWAVVGTSAAFVLGVREDLTLAMAAITLLAFQIRNAIAHRPATKRALVASVQVDQR